MGNLNILPSEILTDTLIRLPTESVLECELVCKRWRNLVRHPSFSHRHLTHLSHPVISVHQGPIFGY
ncbi:hypothetical protein C5167_025509 [Papaver somniferum]|uniref:F-box domain-containing protein n=1 Tax=Papaver somniferum TaxID=3469 RepID=A0A4Y7JUP4_PAPSO|nr:hypothetical protein C5167_025509 [Papaver somniferum]